MANEVINNHLIEYTHSRAGKFDKKKSIFLLTKYASGIIIMDDSDFAR